MSDGLHYMFEDHVVSYKMHQRKARKFEHKLMKIVGYVRKGIVTEGQFKGKEVKDIPEDTLNGAHSLKSSVPVKVTTNESVYRPELWEVAEILNMAKNLDTDSEVLPDDLHIDLPEYEPNYSEEEYSWDMVKEVMPYLRPCENKGKRLPGSEHQRGDVVVSECSLGLASVLFVCLGPSGTEPRNENKHPCAEDEDDKRYPLYLRIVDKEEGKGYETCKYYTRGHRDEVDLVLGRVQLDDKDNIV